ncbi:SDR family NAD(P)-dependent oxidoreductase [Ensifer sp. ENS12]|uniref:SDR family NAD(P)-dependent oxidoreductase n=1 Tax=Ensifer sp. ENS12 TaxID=2854774 RepID=UPI001C4551D5|nr:SDR family oxidoreductase [Ensifer sp. ENS12]MBV7518997.1 SDR family oxidoreductase [Ensifer sp. ENS12]
MVNRLENKVAIVTGAHSGIGLAIAEAFREEGAVVYASDIKASAGNIDHVKESRLDVTDEKQWSQLVGAVLEQQGRIDVLVNNAGGTNYESFHDFKVENWNALIALNQLGPALGMHAVLPAMLSAGKGSIINVSSIFGARAVAGISAYHASKGALLNMTRNAAVSYARQGVRINAVLPGWTDTPMARAQDPKLNEEFIARMPIGRGASPSEIAQPVVFLASDEASFVAGVELPVDGGYLAI